MASVRYPEIAATSSRVLERTLRFAWTVGPTRDQTHEHVFHDDGTVEWHAVERGAARPASPSRGEAPERPPNFATDVGEDASFVSYLSSSGFTLSVVLDFAARSIVGVASNDKQWIPVRGSLAPR
ncbi:MAG: hypothetical protein ABI585_05565 [Betaproteobacteria bacterium]